MDYRASRLSPNNKTYVVLVTYANDGQYAYGHTQEGMNFNLMRKNPMVCFEVDRVTPLMTGETKVHDAITDAHGKFIEALQGVVYKIKLTEITGRFEKRYI